MLVNDLSPGGVQKRTYYMLKFLVKNGVDAYIISFLQPKENSFVMKEIEMDKLADRVFFLHEKSRNVPGFDFFTFKNLASVTGFDLDGMKKVDKIVNKLKPDFIYNQAFLPICLHLKRKFGIKYISHVDDPPTFLRGRAFYSQYMYEKEKVLYREAERVILDSHYHEDYIRNITNNYDVIYHGCIPAERISDNKKYISIPKRHNRMTGVGLQDLAERYREINFLVLGSFNPSTYEKIFMDEIKLRNIENIEVKGNLTEGSLYDYLDQSIAHIGFYIENLGLYVFEGAARGSIPIVPEGIGAQEVFMNNKEMLTYAHDDTLDLKRKIELVIDDKTLQSTLSNNAWLKAKKFSWESFVINIKTIMESVA